MAKKNKDEAATPSIVDEINSDLAAESVNFHNKEDVDSEPPASTSSKNKLRTKAKAERNAEKSTRSNSSKKEDDGEETKDLLSQLPKEKRLKGPLLNLALITFVLALIISLISIIFPFKDVISVNSDVIETLSVEVTISAPQFVTAPAISACQGSGRLSGLPSAKINLAAKDGSWRVSSPLGTGQLNSNGDCVYTPKINTPESFNGGTVKARVDFSFGSSETYTVDGYAINLAIKIN
jgi:hypothetical protein